MSSLTIICLLISLVSGDNDDNMDKLKLQELKTSLLEMERTMALKDMNKDSAIFLGNTKAGRSTLINYIMGNDLEARKKSKYEPILIVKKNTNSRGPTIGEGTISNTKVPEAWQSTKLPNLAIWDTPPLEDNRGPIRDITNAFSIFTLVKSVKSLKIILVIDIRDITEDNTQQFLSLLHSIENLFGKDFADFFPSTSVIFTKVSKTINNSPLHHEFVRYHLQNHFVLDTTLGWSEISKNFIHYLKNHENRIALFRKMMKIGDIKAEDIDVGIFQTINNSTSIEKNRLQKARPSIPAASELSLQKSQEISELEEGITDIARILSLKVNTTEEIVNNSKNLTQLRINEGELQKMRSTFGANLKIKNDLLKKIKSLIESYDHIAETIDKNRLLNHTELIEFIEKKLYINISKQIEFSIDAIAFSMKIKTNTLISIVTAKLEGTTSPTTPNSKATVEDEDICFQLIKQFINNMNKDNDTFKDKLINLLFSIITPIEFALVCGSK